jgi:hypothetical protein
MVDARAVNWRTVGFVRTAADPVERNVVHVSMAGDPL